MGARSLVGGMGGLPGHPRAFLVPGPKKIFNEAAFGIGNMSLFWTPHAGPLQSGYSIGFSRALLVWMLRFNISPGYNASWKSM